MPTRAYFSYSNALKQGCWKGKQEQESQFSKSFQEWSIFYIIHILIYFDAYILKKHAECQINRKKQTFNYWINDDH